MPSPIIIELFLFFLFNIAQTVALIFCINLYIENNLHLHSWNTWFYAWLGTIVALFMVSFFMYHDILPIYNNIVNKHHEPQY